MTIDQATALKETLEAMFGCISRQEPVGEHLVRIGRLQQEVAPTAPPQLNHYLANRSYTKALEYLADGVVIEDPNRPECDEDHP